MSGFEDCGPTALDLWGRAVGAWILICIVVVLLSSSLGATLTYQARHLEIPLERRFDDYVMMVSLLLVVVGYFICTGLMNEYLDQRFLPSELPSNRSALVNLGFILVMWSLWLFLRWGARVLRHQWIKSFDEMDGRTGDPHGEP